MTERSPVASPVEIGTRYSRLVVIADLGRNRHSNRMVECRCDCGNGRIVRLSSIKSGSTKSCGCLSSEVKTARYTIHGDYGSPEYMTWISMIARCHGYRDSYCKRAGVSVCPEWRSSYSSFLNHIGRKPTRDHSIDRINGTKDYEPGNVRWATRKEQQRNLKSNVLVEIGGRRMTVPEWSELCGLKPKTLRQRIRKGWDPELAIKIRVRAPTDPHVMRRS